MTVTGVADGGLDLLQVHREPANLHAGVEAPDELQAAVGQPSRQIARSMQTRRPGARSVSGWRQIPANRYRLFTTISPASRPRGTPGVALQPQFLAGNRIADGNRRADARRVVLHHHRREQRRFRGGELAHQAAFAREVPAIAVDAPPVQLAGGLQAADVRKLLGSSSASRNRWNNATGMRTISTRSRRNHCASWRRLLLLASNGQTVAPESNGTRMSAAAVTKRFPRSATCGTPADPEQLRAHPCPVQQLPMAVHDAFRPPRAAGRVVDRRDVIGGSPDSRLPRGPRIVRGSTGAQGRPSRASLPRHLPSCGPAQSSRPGCRSSSVCRAARAGDRG